MQGKILRWITLRGDGATNVYSTYNASLVLWIQYIYSRIGSLAVEDKKLIKKLNFKSCHMTRFKQYY